jgi:hypothetical protein
MIQCSNWWPCSASAAVAAATERKVSAMVAAALRHGVITVNRGLKVTTTLLGTVNHTLTNPGATGTLNARQ